MGLYSAWSSASYAVSDPKRGASVVILSWPTDPPSPVRYHNLFSEFNLFVPAQDQLYLVMYVLGGTKIPAVLLEGIRLPQRRWNADGEVGETSAFQFGLPDAVVSLLCDEAKLSEAIAGPYIVEQIQADDTIAWSLSPERISSLEEALTPQTIEVLETTALKLICFVCPLCYEGNTDWWDISPASYDITDTNVSGHRR